MGIDNLNFEKLIKNPKTLTEELRKAFESEVTTSLLTTLSIMKLQKKSPLTNDEKNDIIVTVENMFESMMRTHLESIYSDNLD